MCRNSHASPRSSQTRFDSWRGRLEIGCGQAGILHDALLRARFRAAWGVFVPGIVTGLGALAGRRLAAAGVFQDFARESEIRHGLCDVRGRARPAAFYIWASVNAFKKKDEAVCVSAEASFGLTGLLAPVGIYCIKSAAERDRTALPISAVPLMFGFQQFCEGLVWVGVGRGDKELARSAGTAFLFFALAFWLFWIPFSAVFLEQRRKIKMVLVLAATLGLIGGVVLLIPVVENPHALQITVVRHSIRYDYPDPPALKIAPQLVWHLFYLAIVSMPLFLLKNKKLIWFNTALVASAVISHAYFYYAFASIWCFFAASLSLCLGYLFHNLPMRKTASTRCATARSSRCMDPTLRATAD